MSYDTETCSSMTWAAAVTSARTAADRPSRRQATWVYASNGGTQSSWGYACQEAAGSLFGKDPERFALVIPYD